MLRLVTPYSPGPFLKAIRRLKERRRKVEMNSWELMLRQEALACAMHRRDNGKDPHPGDEDVLREVQEAPWFYGLDVPPPSGLTGQGLVRCISQRGGFGSSLVVLGG
jgi:hypothetical protein